MNKYIISFYSFQYTRFDYDWPLFIKDNSDTALKVYILLLICESYCALHLDLAPKMKASAFLRFFRRFAVKQGIPDIMILSRGYSMIMWRPNSLFQHPHSL